MKVGKKRRILVESDDDSENSDCNKIKPKVPIKRSIPDEDIKPLAKVARKTPAKEKETPVSDEDNVKEVAGKDVLLMVDNINKIWAHETLPFLQPNQIRDKNKNRPNHPEYDSRTLYVPADFKQKQTPGKLFKIISS